MHGKCWHVPTTPPQKPLPAKIFPPRNTSAPATTRAIQQHTACSPNSWRRVLTTLVLSCLVITSSCLTPETALAATFCVSNATRLGNALFAAESNGEDDVIKIVQGTYKGGFVYASTEAFGLTIEGGYNAACTSRQVNPTNTVLDASNITIPLALTSTAASDFVVDGLTLQQGHGGNRLSGGLLINTAGGQVTVSHTSIHHTRITGDGTSRGGALTVIGAPIVLLTGNTIQENFPNGVYLPEVSTVTLRNNRLRQNELNGLYIPSSLDNARFTLTGNKIIANGSDGLWIVFSTRAKISVMRNTIRDNKGTAIDLVSDPRFSEEAKVTVHDNIIQNNNSGIFAQVAPRELRISNNAILANITGLVLRYGPSQPSVVALTHNVITSHPVYHGGCGGICIGIFGPNFSANVLVTLTNNIVHGHDGGYSGQGGGVFIDRTEKPVTLVNNVISRNKARQGGGVFIAGSPLVTMTNNTIHGNTATDSGGGAWIALDANSDQADIYNNIIWSNTAPKGADLYLDNDGDTDGLRSPINLFDNDFKRTSVFMELPFPIHGSNLNNVNPLFVDAANGDYRLQATSPLINQGNNTAPKLPTTDQEGQPRIVGGTVDLGAYEND